MSSPDVTPPRRVVFVHGSGRSGSEGAWGDLPALPGIDGVVIDRVGFAPGEPPQLTDFAADAARVVAACGDGAHVVASSYGGVAALQAAVASGGTVLSLLLCEPAAYAISRGDPAIEKHVAAVSPVFARRDDLDTAAFTVELLRAFGQSDPTPPSGTAEMLRAERMRLQRPPWEATLDARVAHRIPTLVVTGGWNEEYEQIAARLVDNGARHVVLEGAGHNPERADGFPKLALDFWRSIDGIA
jgi:pimeloyl-ACP methyl ester carboxylesterase